ALFDGASNCLDVAAPDQIPGVHDALALDVDLAALLEHEIVVEAFVDVVGHLNSTLDIRGFHPCGDVDGIAPDVVEELARTDDSGYHRPCGKADSYRNLAPLRIFEARDGVGHVQRETGQCLHMIVARLRHATYHHVRVAACLDLFEAVQVDQRVEVGVEAVEEA